METSTPKSKKELQRLTSKLLALGRFIARFTDKLRPFFLVLKEAGETEWMENCLSAFKEIKHYLTQAPILGSPQPDERLYMYLALFDWVVNVVLFRCLSHKEHRPVYYISRQ